MRHHEKGCTASRIEDGIIGYVVLMLGFAVEKGDLTVPQAEAIARNLPYDGNEKPSITQHLENLVPCKCDCRNGAGDEHP